jgi:hypothetical protein
MSDNPNPEIRTDGEPETPETTPQPESEPAVPPTKSNVPPEAPADPVDYERKFAESTRENQILAAQLEQERQRNARRELTNQPTDPELQAAFPEWDLMTDTEKRLARTSFTAQRLASSVHQDREQEKADRQWNTDLELTIAQNPSLQGKELAFKEFAKKPTRRGAPLETLVSAFLFEASKVPSSTPSPTPAPTGPTEALPSGNGGPRSPDKPKLLTATELKNLRETNERAYREYVSTHDVSDMLEE